MHSGYQNIVGDDTVRGAVGDRPKMMGGQEDHKIVPQECKLDPIRSLPTDPAHEVRSLITPNIVNVGKREDIENMTRRSIEKDQTGRNIGKEQRE